MRLQPSVASTTFQWWWASTRSTWRAFSGRSTTCCRWMDPCLCTTDTTSASWYGHVYHPVSQIQCRSTVAHLMVKNFLFSVILQAAARHQCSYLVNLHVNDFLQVGGDPKWLNGLDEAPQKLQQLGELNKILAHRPWLLTKEHIEVRGRAWSGGWKWTWEGLCNWLRSWVEARV